MICAWDSFNRARIFVLPCPPAPIMAIFTFSLGATNFEPPSTWRGTIVNAATVVAVAPRNRRRVISGRVAFVFIENSDARSSDFNQGILLNPELVDYGCCGVAMR